MTTKTIDQGRIEAAEVEWWMWHDAESSRWYIDIGEADAACAAWVAGKSDIGPDRDHAHACEVAPVEDGEIAVTEVADGDA